MLVVERELWQAQVVGFARLFCVELGRMRVKGAWITRMKRPGKKARINMERKRKVVVGDVVESGIGLFFEERPGVHMRSPRLPSRHAYRSR